MKWLLTLLLVLISAVAFTLFSAEDPGFVVIGRGSVSLETSLSVLIVVLIVAWIGLTGLFRLLYQLFYLPRTLQRRRFQQQQQKVHTALTQGVLALIQEHWHQAESSLLKTASYSKVPALHYLGAAYAACRAQQPEHALNYVSEAQLQLPEAEPALALFQAKLQLQKYNLPLALRHVQQAHTLAPKDPAVLLLLLALYLQLADWPALFELLPELRKQKVLSAEHLQRLENRVSTALIYDTLRHHPTQASALWGRIPKMTRLRPDILKVYVHHLMVAGHGATAEPLLRESLKYHWDADLILLYGELETNNTLQQLDYAEGLLKTHEKDAFLLLTLGRLCLRSQLWDKAQDYLQASVHLAPHPLVYQLLGDLSTQQANITQAKTYYQQGLELAVKPVST